MKNTLTYLASVTALASGMLFAQTPAPSNPSQPPAQHRQWNRGQMFDRFATKLNLTDDQKTQAKSILQSSRESSQSIAQQLRQSRQALRGAVKAGKSDAEIDQLSANLGQLTGQMTAISHQSVRQGLCAADAGAADEGRANGWSRPWYVHGGPWARSRIGRGSVTRRCGECISRVR